MAYYHYQGVAQKRNDGEMHRPLKTFEILLFSNIHMSLAAHLYLIL